MKKRTLALRTSPHRGLGRAARARAHTAVALVYAVLITSCAAPTARNAYGHDAHLLVTDTGGLAASTSELGNGPASRPKSSESITNVTLVLGSRELGDEFFWQPLDEQDNIGIEIDTYTPGSLGFEFGLHLADASESVLGVPLESDTLELNFGGRKTWGQDLGGLHPFVGGGAALIVTTIDIGNGFLDDSDGGLGFYLHGGAYYTIGDSFNLGFDYRKLFGTDIEFTGFVPTDVDYDQLSFTVGFSF